jgi:LmbE family N-acetylglucosaminyl deacetylase
VKTYLVTATRGEWGWLDDPEDYPGPQALGAIREIELENAARVLGLEEFVLLDYCDGELAGADPFKVVEKIVKHLRRVKPHVVVTFDPNELYGHPDHIAICQLTTAAIIAAADPSYHSSEDFPPHHVSKLYYMVLTQEALAAYQAAFGELVMHIDGEVRQAVGWEPWAITTCIDTSDYWEQVWEAISSHCSQLPGYEVLRDLPDEHHRNLWGTQSYYRAFSLVNGGQETEDDLFAGLRGS